MGNWDRLYKACKDATGTEIVDTYDAHLVVEMLDSRCKSLELEKKQLLSALKLFVDNEI